MVASFETISPARLTTWASNSRSELRAIDRPHAQIVISSSAAVLRCPRNGVVRRHRLHAGICVRDRSQVPAALRQASESFPELGDQRNRYTGPALDVLNRRLIFD